MDTDITHADIEEFQTSQTDCNSNPVQVQMTLMESQIGVNAVSTKNYCSVTGSRSSKLFSI